LRVIAVRRAPATKGYGSDGLVDHMFGEEDLPEVRAAERAERRLG
jgi:hypothetical protein